MRAASRPRPAGEVRILVVGGESGAIRLVSSALLPTLFEPGDLLVVNDAATLPASLQAQTSRGASVELRLVGSLEGDAPAFTVAVLGAGDWRVRTEDRPLAPSVVPGDRLAIHAVDDGREATELVATVTRLRPESPRLVDVALSTSERSSSASPDPAAVWSALYRAGRPVQYAHVPEPLALWDVQNVYAGRPWAVEMPSAGRAFTFGVLGALAKGGIDVATVTHAAGLSSIGDAVTDAMFPLPERFEIPDATWEALARARVRGGRVVAIGTSVVRALEGGARAGVSSGTTDLRIGRGLRRAIVDAVLTGVHEADTSHFALLGAFAPPAVLAAALARAEEAELLGHELGDACLVWGDRREADQGRLSTTSLATRVSLPGPPSGPVGFMSRTRK